jgi:uncharacterized protein (DUF433 family)
MEQAMHALSRVTHSDPDIMGGQPVFQGTRVPYRTFLDYLESGASLDEFLEDFPGVTLEQAEEARRVAERTRIDDAHPSR